MYHLSIKSISRSDGRTATAAAAYRAGAEIIDQRTGELHSYERKRDVLRELSGIALPPGAPGWAEDRSLLWNAAEGAEKRKNSRVARDYEVTIPKELTLAQGADLVRAFAHEISDRYKVAVDFNIHRDDPRNWDGSDKGYQGYHAHILTTTRVLGPNGFGAKSAMEMSDTQRRVLGLGDMATEIERIRQLWEVTANRHLEQAGVDQRIDRRSLKDQGIDREPTVHLGPAVAGLERRGITSRMGDFNREVVAVGKERDGQARALREIGDEIAVLEQPVEAQPAKPKRARSPALDLSVLDGFVEDKGAEGQRQAELTRRHAERGREEQIRRQQEEAKAWALAEIERQDWARQERELKARAQRLGAIAWAREEIGRQAGERDQRLREALREAKERRKHREGVLERLRQSRPEAPRGILATFKEKAHRQAVIAWDDAVKAAAKLADRGRRLVERVSQLARPEQVKRWAESVVRRIAPQAVAWYEEEQARQRAEERTRERARERAREKEAGELQAREQERREKMRLAQEKAQERAAQARPVPPQGPAPKSPRQAYLERDATRAPVLLEKAKTQSLTLDDKHQLLASLTAMGQLHDEGLSPALTAAQRRSIEVARQQLERQVSAGMFLHSPRAETLKQFAGLANDYAVLDAIERHLEPQNLSEQQKTQELQRSWQQIAGAIENGQGIEFRFGKLKIDVSRSVSQEPGSQRDRSEESDRERPRGPDRG